MKPLSWRSCLKGLRGSILERPEGTNGKRSLLGVVALEQERVAVVGVLLAVSVNFGLSPFE